MTAPKSLIDDLERALESGTEVERAAIMSRITDLFVASATRYSAGQVDLFDDVLSKLVTAIEAKARAKLAERLAPVENAPSGVIRRLAFDDNIEVARPVLRYAASLTDSDLIANASSKSQQHLAAISQRRSLTEQVTDVLVTHGNQDVAHLIAKNPGARFSYTGFRVMVNRSQGDDALALALGGRWDMPRRHFLRLLEEASAAVRTRLLAETQESDEAIDHAIKRAQSDIRDQTRERSYDYAVARAKVEPLYREHKLGEAEVQRYARERQFEETVVSLSLLTGVEIESVENAMFIPNHEFLCIIVKLANFSAATCRAILLLKAADRGGIAAPDLEQAMANFGRLQQTTARHLLNFHRARAQGLAVASSGAKAMGDSSARIHAAAT